MTQRPWRILIIDDSPEDRETYRRFLYHDTQNSYVLAEADNAEDGLHLCGAFEPDCVLLDYKLPGGNGLALLHSYDGDSSPPPFAVVMLTGQGHELVAVEALKNGAQDYLIKAGLTGEGLCRAVRQAIATVQRQRQQADHQADLERQVTTDALTGLLNRRHFLERLKQELERVRRYDAVLTLLMIDVDYFKRVNDTYGHLAGDQVLAQTGKVLRGCLRTNDLAARYGGEEFCIVAASTDLEGGRAFAERVRELVQVQQFSGSGQDLFGVTCSIGVAAASIVTSSAEELITRADAALYQAKNQGRNRVCVAGPALA